MQTEKLGKLFLVGKSTLARADTESIIARMRDQKETSLLYPVWRELTKLDVSQKNLKID